MARRKRTARSAAWAAKHKPQRRAAVAVRDPREALRAIEERNLAARRASVRTMPPGPALVAYVPAPAPARTLWEAATGTRRVA